VTLTEKWSNGVTSLHGMHIRGFPNCFMMSIAQSGLTVNFPYMLNEQGKHIGYIVAQALTLPARSTTSSHHHATTKNLSPALDDL